MVRVVNGRSAHARHVNDAFGSGRVHYVDRQAFAPAIAHDCQTPDLLNICSGVEGEAIDQHRVGPEGRERASRANRDVKHELSLDRALDYPLTDSSVRRMYVAFVRNRLMILTIAIMKTIPEAILAYAHDSPEGHILSPKDFLHMGNRTAVDQALSRLSRDGLLLRVERGVYVAPVREQGCLRPPSAEKVVQSLAGQSGEIIAPDGATSAIAFGIEENERAARGYITSGRSRTLLIGSVEVTLRHAPLWMLALGNGSAGAAVRAMAWAGPDAADTALAKIRLALSNAEWLTLVTYRSTFPSWMARAIGASEVRNPGLQPARRSSGAASRSAAPNVHVGTPLEITLNQTTGTT